MFYAIKAAVCVWKKCLNKSHDGQICLVETYVSFTLLQLEEFLPIYSQAKKDKDQGQYEDFLECLKLYDKNENGLMLGAELTHTLLALGKNLQLKTISLLSPMQFSRVFADHA